MLTLTIFLFKVEETSVRSACCSWLPPLGVRTCAEGEDGVALKCTLAAPSLVVYKTRVGVLMKSSSGTTDFKINSLRSQVSYGMSSAVGRGSRCRSHCAADGADVKSPVPWAGIYLLL